MDNIKGNCECKKISFEINQAIKYFSHCHCSQCRKCHGSAFGSFVEVEKHLFRYHSGERILNLIRLLNIASENFVEFVDQTLCFLMKEILINIMFQQAL